MENLKKVANKTQTENGAESYKSTGSYCLDLFASIGALRLESERNIVNKFIRAYTENKDIAMKILFFCRDIREGLGERKVFRTIFHWLAQNKPDSVCKNLEHVSEFGRFDDLLCLLNTPCEKAMLNVIKKQFEADMTALQEDGREVSLLAKWLPSVNASDGNTVLQGKRIARALNLKERDYRKALTALRARIHIIENNLREKDYTFDYEKQPSRALFKYRKAFERNDDTRFTSFLNDVQKGKAIMHTANISPYELLDPFLGNDWCDDYTFLMPIDEDEEKVLNVTWASLPDYGNKENALAVIDTSGSMYYYGRPRPASVALSLGLYFAEHNTGIYKNCFIEFSDHPQLIEIKGETFVDKLRYVTSFSQIAGTNLEAVFDLILDAAVQSNVPQEELPAKLIIISDMEFNRCVQNSSLTNFENAKQKYAEHGYRLPQIVFWNVACRNNQQPVTVNDRGVALVSGTNPHVFSMIEEGSFSPYAFMAETVSRERYASISA